MGRPLKEIDEERVAQMILEGATVNEVALCLDVEDETLHRRFKKLIAKKKAERRVTIRKWQYEQARQGNVGMLVWLGKNELKQTDKPEPQTTKVIVTYADRGIDDPTDEAAQGSKDDPETGG